MDTKSKHRIPPVPDDVRDRLRAHLMAGGCAFSTYDVITQCPDAKALLDGLDEKQELRIVRSWNSRVFRDCCLEVAKTSLAPLFAKPVPTKVAADHLLETYPGLYKNREDGRHPLFQHKADRRFAETWATKARDVLRAEGKVPPTKPRRQQSGPVVVFVVVRASIHDQAPVSRESRSLCGDSVHAGDS
ncbi:MAG: hypothetical protein ACXIUZ_00735 [Lysobacteraceae bacterium]